LASQLFSLESHRLFTITDVEQIHSINGKPKAP